MNTSTITPSDSPLAPSAKRLLPALLVAIFFSFGCGLPMEESDPQAPLDTAEAAVNGGSQCTQLKGSAHPNVISHLHDAALQQFVGRARIKKVSGRRLQIGRKRGALLGTVTGQDQDGNLIANHHWSFDRGVLRTQADVVALTPTADPCVLDLNAQFFFVDGSGVFTGLSGSGQGVGSLNGCNGEVDMQYQATLCP